MIAHFLSGQNIQLAISDNEKVSTVKKRIQEIVCTPQDKLSLVFNGIILDDDSTMGSYHITNNCRVTAVKSPRPVEPTIEEQERQVEDYLISLCGNLRRSHHAGIRENTSHKDKENITVFEQLIHYPREVSTHWNVDQIIQRMLSEDYVLDSYAKNAFMHTIIKDPKLVRSIIITHPLIIKLIEINPGIQEFIEDDANINALLAIILQRQNPEQTSRGKSLLKLVEAKIGHKLVLSQEHIDFLNAKKQYAKTRKPISPEDSIQLRKGCHVTEEQKKAVMDVITTHPELVISFIKGTPMYKYIAQRNPLLLKEIMTPERLQKLFSPESLESFILINKQLKHGDKKEN